MNMASMRQSLGRHRKQRFPRRKTPVSESGKEDEYDSEEEEYSANVKRFKVVPNSKSLQKKNEKNEDKVPVTPRIDKRARDEHNEQERSRRRELAVIYELIRCSFTNDDLRHLGAGNIPKSIDKLSYPQVLHIAYQILLEEHHNIMMYEKTVSDIRRLEKEFARYGLTIPVRPTCPSVTENYKKVVQIVENLLKHDKIARNPDGVYEMSPAERAANGDQQLAFLRNRQHVFSSSIGCYSSDLPQYNNVDRRNQSRKNNRCANIIKGSAPYEPSHDPNVSNDVTAYSPNDERYFNNGTDPRHSSDVSIVEFNNDVDNCNSQNDIEDFLVKNDYSDIDLFMDIPM